MKELQEILKKIAEFVPDEKAILATVVDIKGSSYRRAGARMLIDEHGNSIGTVSGGCLEADVLEHAKKVLKTCEPAIITYNTIANEDSVFGLGMGCKGIIRILLEPATNNSLLDFLNTCFNERKRGAVATLIAKDESFSLPTGAKIFVLAKDKIEMSFNEIEVERNSILQDVIADTARAIEDNRSYSKLYETSKGEVEFFIEVINPPVSLLIFGAGSDALPLAGFAKDLGWRVSVIDHRAAWTTRERFPNVDEIIVSRPSDLNEILFRDENSVAVIMTHNSERDAEILPRLLKSSCKYIGVLGPKKRTEKMLEGINEPIDEEQLKRLYAPVGLDIGADTPEEIALAIIAEIRSALAGRSGGFLRDKQRIH